MKRVTKDGVITVEEAKGTDTYVDEVVGMQFDRGYLSPYFITNTENMTTEYDNPLILIHDKRFQTCRKLYLYSKNQHNLGVPFDHCRRCRQPGIGVLVVNRLRGIKSSCCKAPGFGDRRKAMLEDIAVLTGGTVISDEKGYKLENVQLSDLGQAEKSPLTKTILQW